MSTTQKRLKNEAPIIDFILKRFSSAAKIRHFLVFAIDIVGNPNQIFQGPIFQQDKYYRYASGVSPYDCSYNDAQQP